MRRIKSAVYLCVGVCAVALAGVVFAQAPGVEIVRDKGEQFDMLVKKANILLEKKELLSLDDVSVQIKRKSCKIDLPPVNTTVLSDREIWQRTKDAHLRVGWHYRCKKCEKWHQNLAGGYFITTNGAVATCYHVIDKDKDDYREAYLVVANDKGDLLPVKEILAANEQTDTAIIMVQPGDNVAALPLNPNTYPSDAAWCYSDPLGRSGYFSKGIINRFYVYKKNDTESSRIELSTDWAPGSSGAAVVDVCGNAIGHVSEISSAGTGPKKPVVRSEVVGTNKVMKVMSDGGNQMIIFHCAARAADVISLVEKAGEKPAAE